MYDLMFRHILCPARRKKSENYSPNQRTVSLAHKTDSHSVHVRRRAMNAVLTTFLFVRHPHDSYSLTSASKHKTYENTIESQDLSCGYKVSIDRIHNAVNYPARLPIRLRQWCPSGRVEKTINLESHVFNLLFKFTSWCNLN